MREHSAARPPLPPFVQSLAWIFFPTQFLSGMEKRYGDRFTLRFAGFPPIHVTSRPEDVKQVFGGEPGELPAGAANVILKPLVGPSSLLLLDGAKHTRHRRLMLPPFHGERMAAYGETIRSIARAAVARWPRGTSFRLHKEMQEVTLEVILRTVFGMSGPKLERLGEALNALLAYGEKSWLMLFIDRDGDLRGEAWQKRLGRFSPWTKFREVRRRVDTILDEEIAAIRNAPDANRQDILAMLVAARDEDGNGLSDDELRDEMVTLLIAGHETTATSLTWAIAELAIHTDVREELQRRVQANDHDFVDAVAKEALRLHPVVPMVGRIATKPLQLGDMTIPAGEVIAPSIYLTQRRSELWNDPDVFRPDRFVGKKISPAEFFPFGGGARRCIGAAFALYEMRIVLEEITRAVTLDLRPGYKLKVARRGVTFTPADGLPVVAR